MLSEGILFMLLLVGFFVGIYLLIDPSLSFFINFFKRKKNRKIKLRLQSLSDEEYMFNVNLNQEKNVSTLKTFNVKYDNKHEDKHEDKLSDKTNKIEELSKIDKTRWDFLEL